MRKKKLAWKAPSAFLKLKPPLHDLTLGKSPGGLGACFYKAFKSELAVALYGAVRKAYEVKQLSTSFKKSHVVFIPKSEDATVLLSVAAYRPISLINVDYKILMKVLGIRLQGVIKYIVGPHQTCGIKGRTITTNINALRSILECVDALEGQAAILQLDLEKAFDRVTHEILFDILQHVNVGSVILDGVEMSYSMCEARLIVNKNVTDSFPIRCSVKQG